MPKRSKGKFRPYRISMNNDEAEIFRNTSAVLDDTDPHISLQYMKDIFRGRLDEDVITMIFSECAYNVDQALETLESLCNDEAIPTSKEIEDVYKNKQIEEGSSNGNFNLYPSAFVSNAPKSTNVSFNPTNASEKISQDIQFDNYSLCSSYTPNEACFVSDPHSPLGIHTQKIGSIFSPTYYSIPATNISSSNIDTTSLPVQEKCSKTDPQFVTPIYNFNRVLNPDAHTNTSFQGRSRKFHTSVKNHHTRKDERKIKEALTKITSGSYVLVIVRGLPGSGKSYLAAKLKFSGEVFSTDDFFINRRGEYIFEPSKLSEAHAWNKHRTKQALEKGVTPVIIDNTNVEAWEIMPYVLLGKKYNYEIIILEPDTPWKFNVHELSLRNKHGVLKSKISRMKEKYQHNVTVDKVLASVNLLNSKNIDIFSGDSDLNKIVVKKEEGHIVDILNDNALRNNNSVKADIHQEETPTDNMLLNLHVTDSVSHSNSSLWKNTSQENVDCKLRENEPHLNENDKKVVENLISDQSVDGFNLDELRALAKEDSEDSTSIHSSVNGSSQDVSGWEAITEHDDDFLWSTNSEDLKSSDENENQGLESTHLSNSKDPQFDISVSNSMCLSQAHTDTAESGPEETPIHLHQVPDFLKSKYTLNKTKVSSLEKVNEIENQTRTPFRESKEKLWIECDVDDGSTVEISKNTSLGQNNLASAFNRLVIDDSSSKINNKDLIAQAKPQRSNIDCALNFNRENFNDASMHEKNVEFSLLEDLSDWNIVETPVDKEDSKLWSNISVDAAPKPQREIFENNASSFTSMINRFNLPKKRASLLNISVDLLDCDWSFPDYTSPSIDEKKNHVKQISNASTYSQTEPYDFIVIHKVSTGCENSDLEQYTVLNARVSEENVLHGEDIKEGFDKQEQCITQIATFDKSTSTDDLVQDLEMCKKLDHLQACFPDIAVDDLHHLLDICHNDETWISNLLLEWGYKYNVQNDSCVNDKNTGTSSAFNEKCSNVASFEIFTKDYLFKNSNQPLEVNDTIAPEDKESAIAPNNSEFKKLQLVLDSAFARQLQEIFGPVGSLDSEDDLCVDIDLDFAHLLHTKWKESICKTKSISKKLEPKVSNLSYLKNENEGRIRKDLAKDPKDLTLSEIMDMEYAIQLHKQEKLKKDTDFATKLKRLELYNMFPGADTMALDEIFESNNYSLKDTVFALGEDIGQEETIQKQQNQNVEQIDQHVTEWSNTNVFKEFEQGDWSGWVYQEENIGTVIDSSPALSNEYITISPEASKFRDLAAKHYQLRQQFISKAQTAYCRGMKDVASFYAQKGSEHGQLFKEANKNASFLIAHQRNMTSPALVIDLHGLYIQEAIPLLEKFIREKKNDISQRKQTTPTTISIITGQGLHSMKGPKLRPSVIEYLKKTGYNFYEVNRGMVEVTITPD